MTMNITKIINEGLELQKEVNIINERIAAYKKELEKIEDLFKEIELVQNQEYESYVEWKNYSDNNGVVLRF